MSYEQEAQFNNVHIGVTSKYRTIHEYEVYLGELAGNYFNDPNHDTVVTIVTTDNDGRRQTKSITFRGLGIEMR